MQEKSLTLAGRPAQHFRGFKGFKNQHPVQYSLRCCRDALIQATLDRHVQAIAPTPFDATDAKAFFAFEASVAGKQGIVALTDRPNAGLFPPPAGLGFGITIAISQVRAEPLLSNARLVWSHKEKLVPAEFQIRALQALGKSRAGLALADLRSVLSSSYPRWLDFVFTMAARGDVEFDNLSQFAEGTRVYWRPQAPQTSFFANPPLTAAVRSE